MSTPHDSVPRWQNRITRYSEEAPSALPPSPLNWRTHPQRQADALTGVLGEVGIVQNVLMNERTGRLIDGHLRVALAVRDGQPTLPVTWVDLSEAEEREVLATLDPIGTLAQTDGAALDALLRGVASGEEAVQTLLADLYHDAADAALTDAAARSAPDSHQGLTGTAGMIKIVIACADLAPIEAALAATGEINRAAALGALATTYLAHAHAAEG